MFVGRSRLTVVLGAALLASASMARGETLSGLLGGKGTTPIADALARAVGRALPIVSASSGVVYTFDVSTGAFVRETSILGQLFLERAQPLGKGRFNFGISYQWVRLDTFAGEDLHHLHDRVQIQPTRGGSTFTVPFLAVDLETHQLTASATYGLTDDVDVNLTVPLLTSDFSRRFTVTSPSFEGGPVRDGASATKIGFGDIFLRGKYRVLERDGMQAAMGLVLRLPAGNEKNFQGTGELEIGPRLYVSTAPILVGRWFQVQPYANAGITFVSEDVASSEANYGLGLDCGVPERFTAAVAFLGRSAFERIAPAGSLSFRRIDGSSRPLFGIEDRRADMFDLSIGGRANLFRGIVIGFANVIVALNDEGVRSDVIPMVGMEASF
jgi:hypothetical protein